MLVRLKYPGAVWALVLCLVLVNGFMAAPSVAHAEHHGTHKAGTHATGICAWFCAAGQGVESSPVDFESALQLHYLTDHLQADQPTLSFSTDVLLRGPPISRTF